METIEPDLMHAHHLVFIAGVHRSGTTILADSLGEHPDVSGLTETGVPMNEGQFLQTVYAPAGTKRKLWPIRYLKSVTPSFLSMRGYGGPGRFGFDPGAVLDESSPLLSSENAEKIFRSWAPYWDLGRTVLVEKSPPNLLRTRFLQGLFPRTSFIVIRRHPIPVSYATRLWANRRPFHLLIEHWLRCNERFEVDRPHLQNVISISYEDFVRAPQEVMARVHGFLGIDPIPVSQEVLTSINDKYFHRWSSDTQGSYWRRKYAEFMIDRFESRLNRFGYSLTEPWLTHAPTSD